MKMNLNRNSVIILFGFIILSCGVFLIINHNKENKNPLDGKEFVGYIPKDALPKMVWIKENSIWVDLHTIKVVIAKDTVDARFFTDRMPGLKYILYKGSYPPSIDSIVYVRGHYRNNGTRFIDCEASLYPLEE